MKSFFINMKKRIWFVPSLYSLLSLILAFITIMVDYYWGASMSEFLPDFMMTQIDLAQTVLSSIAGSLLAMTTFTFSTVMVVLTTYSSQFSPRALKNFVNDKTTLRGLGIFMGGFIYCITALLFMRESIHQDFVTAAFFGVVYAIVCLAFFAYFIHHVATSIQISSLIGRLEKESLQVLDFYKGLQKENIVQQEKVVPPLFQYKKEVSSKESGFLQFVDFKGLKKHNEENDFYVELNVRVGKFIKKGEPLYTIYSNKECKEDLREYMSLGSERFSSYDLEFSMQRIVEIAVRAVSPSINDPNTARDCIRYLGVLMSETYDLKDGQLTMTDKEGKPRVNIPFLDFEKLLYKTFYQIVHYAKEDISVILTLIDAIIVIIREMPDERQKTVYSFHQYILQNIDKDQLQEWDLKFLNEKIELLDGQKQ